MKKFMALAVLSTMITTVWAKEERWFESHKPVSCGPFLEIIQLVTGPDFREQPLWIGRSHQDTTQYVLLRNPTTGSWTLVQYGKEIGCVLGMGQVERTHEFDPALGNKNKP